MMFLPKSKQKQWKKKKLTIHLVPMEVLHLIVHMRVKKNETPDTHMIVTVYAHYF